MARFFVQQLGSTQREAFSRPEISVLNLRRVRAGSLAALLSGARKADDLRTRRRIVGEGQRTGDGARRGR